MARRVLEHRDDALGRRRDNRQPVGEAALVQRLEGILELADRQLARDDAARRPARAAPRAARRPPDRVSPSRTPAASRAGRRRAACRPPPRPAPPSCRGQPLDPVTLGAVVEQQDGGHGGGVEALRQRQLVVGLRDARELQPRGLRSGVLGRGLRDQARPGRVQRGQHLVADRAVMPDQREHLERHSMSVVGAATTSARTARDWCSSRPDEGVLLPRERGTQRTTRVRPPALRHTARRHNPDRPLATTFDARCAAPPATRSPFRRRIEPPTARCPLSLAALGRAAASTSLHA